jgi:hypothetical protein
VSARKQASNEEAFGETDNICLVYTMFVRRFSRATARFGPPRAFANKAESHPQGGALLVARPAARAMSSGAGGGGDRLMYEVIPKSDHGAFKEYSVIHTDRSLNLMSDPFQRVMRDLNRLLKHTYHADKVVIIPG